MVTAEWNRRQTNTVKRLIHNAYEVLVEGRVSMREELHFYLNRTQLLETVLTANGIPIPDCDD